MSRAALHHAGAAKAKIPGRAGACHVHLLMCDDSKHPEAGLLCACCSFLTW